MQTKRARAAPDDKGGGDPPLSSAALFALVWNAVADVLGTAAVAAIVRRAAVSAAVEFPELGELVVKREQLEYRCTLPAAWSVATQTVDRNVRARRALFAEIGRLLVELTGTLVVNRLEQIPELRGSGLASRMEDAN